MSAFLPRQVHWLFPLQLNNCVPMTEDLLVLSDEFVKKTKQNFFNISAWNVVSLLTLNILEDIKG